MTFTANDITGASSPTTKGSARNPANVRYQPSATERVLEAATTPDPPIKELFTRAPTLPAAIMEALLRERVTIARNAHAEAPEGTSVETVERLTDALFNNGFSLEKLKAMAVLSTDQQIVDDYKQWLQDAGLPIATTADELQAAVGVARAVLRYVSTHHAGEINTPALVPKTPLKAWRVKERIVNFLATNTPQSRMLEGNGDYDNRQQLLELDANFAKTELILWDTDIWIAAVRNCTEVFEHSELTTEMIDSIVPMFWQFNTPIMPVLPPRDQQFKWEDVEYECAGFSVMPTVEQFQEVRLPSEAVTEVKDLGMRGVLVGLSGNEATKHALDTALRISRRGISVSLIYLPLHEPNSGPQIRFMRPIFEHEKITGAFMSMILAAAKFLTLKYVVKTDAAIARRELKTDRELFKKVRKGRVQIPPIKIINLRRPEKRSHAAHSDEAVAAQHAHREYSCHFLVDSHWRRQWYPTEQRHRPVYILSFPKGDFSKPFKAPREKVYKAVR